LTLIGCKETAKQNGLTVLSELYRNEKARVREAHQPLKSYAGISGCQQVNENERDIV